MGPIDIFDPIQPDLLQTEPTKVNVILIRPIFVQF